MKVTDLFESVSIGGGLIAGGMKKWKERWGATDADIQQAMRTARELPSYKELLTYTKEITSPTQARNGTIAFESRKKAWKQAYKTSPNARWGRHDENQGWNRTYVHFYGQVRTGTNKGQYNSPVKSIPPRTFPGDPVRTIVGAYNNGFKVILNRFKRKRTKTSAELVKKDVTNFLQEKFPNHVLLVGFDEAHRNFIVFPKNLFEISREVFGNDGDRKVNFMSDLIDDPAFGADLKDKLMDRLKRKHAKMLSEVGDKNELMFEVAEALNNEYTKYEIEAEAMLMSEYQDRYKMFASGWGGVHRLIAEAVIVIDIRNNHDDDEVIE